MSHSESHDFDLSQVTAIICSLNSESSIFQCLSALTQLSLKEIIVVDGGSTDKTLEIVRNFSVTLLSDQGKGLGAARNLGLDYVNSPYTLNVGADNVIPKAAAQKILRSLQDSDRLAAVGCVTNVLEDNVLGKVFNLQWQAKERPGKTSVVGTPNMFPTSLLKEFRYSSFRRGSDDEELCTRITNVLGLEFLISDSICFEIGQATFPKFVKRYLLYVYSDFEIWKAGSDSWGISRKIRSLVHPFSHEVINMYRFLDFFEAIVVTPFAILACTLRYAKWISLAMRSRFKRFEI